MPPVSLYAPDQCLAHDTGTGHPESPQRLALILDKLSDLADHVINKNAAPGTEAQILLAHTPRYWQFIQQQKPGDVPHNIDGDTVFSKGSLAAALYGVGSVCNAVDDMRANNTKRAFVACRPPSHHACRDTSMGFCIFNAVAIGAKWAVQNGFKRPAIIDFDVHHANGTQDIVGDDANILLVSLQQKNIWPYNDDEQITHDSLLNIGLEKNLPIADYRNLITEKVIPTLRAFAPDIIFLSAGFDAHKDDPPKGRNLFNDATGEQSLANEDFYWLTQQIVNVANETADGRIISSLEGGYNLSVLPGAVEAHLKALAEG